MFALWWHLGSRPARQHIIQLVRCLPEAGSNADTGYCIFRYRTPRYFASAGLNNENRTQHFHAHGQRRLRPGSGHQKLLRASDAAASSSIESCCRCECCTLRGYYIYSLYVSARQRVEMLGWLKYGAASRSWFAVALSSFSFLRYFAHQSSRSARTCSPRNSQVRLKLFALSSAPLFTCSCRRHAKRFLETKHSLAQQTEDDSFLLHRK